MKITNNNAESVKNEQVSHLFDRIPASARNEQGHFTSSQEVASSILASSTIFNSLQTRHTIKGNKKVTANLTCAASRPGAVQRSAAFGPCSRYSAQVRSRWPGRLRRTRSEAVAAGSDAGRSLRYRRNYADHAGTHHPIMDVMRCVNLRR